MRRGMSNQKAAVESGYWPLFRFNPALLKEGQNPFKLDSKAPKISLKEYAYMETRYKMLTKSQPEHAEKLIELAQEDVDEKWTIYENLVKDYEPKKENS
jgi:pyruvate-ferredoxin/flavodoxin oxidoreductase